MTPCQCGCGQPAPIAKATDPRRGHVKGQQVRFIHGHHRRRPKADRLWAKVEKQPGDGCWLWTGARNTAGYGLIRVAGRLVLAHRLAWELTHGPIPPETPHVLHNCPGADNPLCVRHLWLGTHADNMRDMVAKGRNRNGGLSGEQIGTAKLTEPQVIEIHRGAAAGESQSAIARRFSISRSAVQAILAGRNWAGLVAQGQPS